MKIRTKGESTLGIVQRSARFGIHDVTNVLPFVTDIKKIARGVKKLKRPGVVFGAQSEQFTVYSVWIQNNGK